MSIQENITREEISHRGGGVELDLSDFGYEDEYLSAYQNYLGGGMRGAVANSCTIEDWEMDERLVRLASELRDYYDEDLKHWCDPLDPDCNRVLTIMLAEEY